jgi:hypothetical protein
MIFNNYKNISNISLIYNKYTTNIQQIYNKYTKLVMYIYFLIIIHFFFIKKMYEFSYSIFKKLIYLFYYLKIKYSHLKTKICLYKIKTHLIQKLGKDVYCHILTKDQSLSSLINENTQIEIYQDNLCILIKNLKMFTLIYTFFMTYYYVVHLCKIKCPY